MSIENPMVIDSLWRREPKVIGECDGCGQSIYSFEDYYDMQDQEETVLVHQNSECCFQFVADRSVCRSGRE